MRGGLGFLVGLTLWLQLGQGCIETGTSPSEASPSFLTGVYINPPLTGADVVSGGGGRRRPLRTPLSPSKKPIYVSGPRSPLPAIH
jgi:hypothetical protein